jgi:hypothetical protein
MSYRTDAQLTVDISNIANLIVSDGKISAAELRQVLQNIVDSKPNPSGPTTGQVIKWNGSAWVADVDQTGASGSVNITTYGLQIRDGSTSNTFSNGTQPAVVIGLYATAADNTMSTQVGNYSNTTFTTTYANYTGNNTVDGPEKIAFGHKATAPPWRAIAIGSYALAGATSSLALGTFAWSNVSHGMAIGKAAMNIYDAAEGSSYERIVIGDLSSPHVYFGNGQGHQFDTHPIQGTVVSGPYTPSSCTTTIHGHDAKDLRASPSDFNVSGGNIRIAAGAATGSGTGGFASLAANSALASNPGANVKKALIDFLIADGAEDGTSASGLKIYWNGTVRRVHIGAADSAGTGFRTLKMAN